MSKIHIIRFSMLLAILFAIVGGPGESSRAQVPGIALPPGCWSIVPTPTINAQSSEITAMSALSADNVWAVGSALNSAPGGKSYAFSMHYDGSGWQVAPTTVISEGYVLQDVAAVAPDNVWAVGSFVYSVPTPGYDRGKLILHWDGKSWKVSLKGNPGALKGVWATSADDVWAVGETARGTSGPAAVVHHWDGRAWSETPIGTLSLNDVTALSRDDVWVMGSATYHWDGRQWALMEPDTREKSAIWEASPNDVWTVGAGASHWNGADWSGFPTTADSGAQLRAAAGRSASDIWAAGAYEGGALLVHWDGSKWTGMPNPFPGFETSLSSITRVGDEIWAGGKRTLRADGADVMIARHTRAACPEAGPPTPLNPPVPLPGTETLPFATGKSINGVFLKYWQTHGGLSQQGYPITDVMGEISDLDGKVYTVQYFERAIFEYHPELKGTAFEVLLSQLGTFQYQRKYPDGAPNQRPNRDVGTLQFPETGKRLGGTFLKYWQEHGGLQQQGFPISDEFTEVSEADGKPYTVQYFERSVFEWHPENAAPYNVLLSLLGNFRYGERYLQTPGAPPENEPRLIASNVQNGRLQGGGKYLVWNETPESGSRISVYDAAQNRRVAASTGGQTLASADSKQAVWSSGAPNSYTIYNLASGATFTATVPPGQLAPGARPFDEFALENDTLYGAYKGTSNNGIAALNLIRRDSENVTLTRNLVEGLKASNGLVLWTEKSTSGALEESLHVWSPQARSAVVPASGLGAFSGYGAWGDYVTWSFYSTITNQITYLYNTRTGARKVLSTGAASGPVIGDGMVAWVRWPGTGQGETGGFEIEVYDIATEKITTVVQGFPSMPGNLMLMEGDKLAFTADVDLGAPGYDLFLVQLGE